MVCTTLPPLTPPHTLPLLQRGKTPMDVCAASSSDADTKAAVLELLRKHGARHSLHYEAQYGVVDDVAAHIAEGADLDARDQVRHTHMRYLYLISSFCICMCVYIYICMYIYTYIYIFVCVYVCVCVYGYICMYIEYLDMILSYVT